MGYVYSESEGRESFYELQEPLMRICLEAKTRRGTLNQLFISFLRVWFSCNELENCLKILPLEAIFDRECTRLALSEMETSDDPKISALLRDCDPKISALLRDWNDAWEKADREKMLETSEEFIQVRGSGLDWIRKAESCYWLGKKDDSLKALDKAVEIDDNAETWTQRGYYLGWFKLYDQSLISYQKSINLDVNSAWTWSLKAISEAQIGNRIDALNSIVKALQLDNKNSTILGNASLVYKLLGKNVEALNFIDQAIQFSPDINWLWQRKGNILLDLDINESLQCYQQAIILNPTSSVNYYRLSLNYLAMGNYIEALNSINRSIKLFEFSRSSWELKGEILRRMDLFIDAIKCYYQSVNLEIRFSQSLWTSWGLNIIKLHSKKVIISIFKLGTTSQEWLKDSELMLEIYAQHNLLDDLSGGLVESIKAINESSTSDHTAQAWLEMWQNLAGQYDEFQVALNLLKVAVEYKINRALRSRSLRDRRVLLQLPQEERQILEELLNPETV
jgi:tetratricopeptide (TPR) repeat protein